MILLHPQAHMWVSRTVEASRRCTTVLNNRIRNSVQKQRENSPALECIVPQAEMNPWLPVVRSLRPQIRGTFSQQLPVAVSLAYHCVVLNRLLDPEFHDCQ